MRTLIADIETDGLLDEMTKLHSLVIEDADTGEVWSCYGATLCIGLKLLSEADCVIFHNGVGFDLPALRRLYPNFKLKDRCIVRDTLILTRLIWSDLKDIDFRRRHKQDNQLPDHLIGSHGLKAWGHRLGVLKGDFGEQTDWKEWSPEMQGYCEQDVKVTKVLWQTILSKRYSEQAIDLEHSFAEIIFRQEQHGFVFNEQAAGELYATLSARRQEIEEELQRIFPPKRIEMKTPAYHTLVTPGGKERCDTKTEARRLAKQAGWKPKQYAIERGPNKVKEIPFSPSSRDEIANRLIEKYDWKPTKLTNGGKPAVDEDTLSGLKYPEAQAMLDYLMVQKRLGQLAEGQKAWLKLVRDGRIHGRVNTNGAVTGRCTHSNPNLTQVPSIRVEYGPECRALFCVPPGWKQVGCDASGLELRCLAHFMAPFDGGAYGKIVAEGDVHTANQKAAGLATRDQAKTFIYSWLYGAGDYKIGTVTGVTKEDVQRFRKKTGAWNQTANRLKKQDIVASPKNIATTMKGAELKRRFLKRMPALKKLIDGVKKAAKDRGYLKGIDGRRLHVRSAHAALNTLLQSAGGLVMKQALVILDRDLTDAGLTSFDPDRPEARYDYAFVANVHDEFQAQVREEHADDVSRMAEESIRKAGEHFGFRCPLAGEAHLGDNWSETH